MEDNLKPETRNSKPKGHLPLRRCVACRRAAPKSSLIRVVRPPGTQRVELDRTGKAAGRGAYLCPLETCLKTALKKGALQRALKVQLSPEVIRELTGGGRDDQTTGRKTKNDKR